MKWPVTWGMLCLAIYLILIGVIALFEVQLGKLAFIPAVLALLAGILILIGK